MKENQNEVHHPRKDFYLQKKENGI